jgi:hypothetical protein
VLIEASERCINHFVSRHDDLVRKIVDRQPGTIPELGAGGTRENGLNLDSFVTYLVMERLVTVLAALAKVKQSG